ncbi:MAG: PHP domain protein [Candidatus Collierbacteria bacterium GW2011_GWC2_44_18]|uniref:PHP domain protein n=2 Tax=Microgenomates group TaxID=1794810 RepID=A0A0G1J7L8_9BACT|nr:MAG: PHP domain protein [Candidatus Collierbacteria bacterium GW2011_GWC2_44_18]KKT67358.1 MAG: PHP domain protein [Candidatus Woesebacteria bacterium GW2011_GWA2_44_33]
MTVNRETAQLLERVAAVFRVKEGDTFRVKAYLNAATVIDSLTEPLAELWRQGKLDTVPGLGKALVGYLGEYFAKGKVRHFSSQLKKVPAGMFALMEIRGVGPITAYKLAKKFHLSNEKTALQRLQQLIKAGKLSKIESFKEKSVVRLTKSLKIRNSGKGRMLLSEALSIAEDYISYLKESPLTIAAEPLGSLRRRLSTVGDIDLALNTKHPEESMAYVLSYPQISSVITKGDRVSHVKLQNGFEVDIKLSEPLGWGSLLQHYTGSKMHNIHLRTIAKEKGLSLSEYGIKQNGRLKGFKNEKDFYRFLGMQMIPPEIREDTGEIELSLQNKLRELVNLKDIKGDLHIHSNFDYPSSHDQGVSPLRDILDKAYQLGYEYLGVSDHNPKYFGLTEKETESILSARKKYLEQDFRAYEKAVKNRGIKLLIGMEVDIRPDGDLALSKKLMNTLDYAIVSIHSSFDKGMDENTDRIISALSHPKAVILGHPTGRIINNREPITADWEKIFNFCAKNNKILEVNAYPDRLDLSHDLIRMAIGIGVRLIINTDSHEIDQMELMKYGVWQARKGYATKNDIVNSLSWKNFQAVLK